MRRGKKSYREEAKRAGFSLGFPGTFSKNNFFCWKKRKKGRKSSWTHEEFIRVNPGQGRKVPSKVPLWKVCLFRPKQLPETGECHPIPRWYGWTSQMWLQKEHWDRLLECGVYYLFKPQTDRQTDNSVVGALKRGNEGPEALSPGLF